MTDADIRQAYTGSLENWTVLVTATESDASTTSYSFTCTITARQPEREIRNVSIDVIEPERWPPQRVQASLLKLLESDSVAEDDEITMSD